MLSRSAPRAIGRAGRGEGSSRCPHPAHLDKGELSDIGFSTTNLAISNINLGAKDMKKIEAIVRHHKLEDVKERPHRSRASRA